MPSRMSRLRNGLSQWVRANPALSINEYINLLNSFNYGGVNYTLPGATQEDIGFEFVQRARSAYKSNGIVFSCMLARMSLFSEARFQFREMQNGRPGDLFGTPALAPLENPWPGATTGDLLTRALQFNDLVGNAFMVRLGSQIRFLRPDWVTLILGSMEDRDVAAWDAKAEVLGYIYQPGGRAGGREPVTYLAAQVAHFASTPDPESQFRGMSWLTPVIQEIMADKAATTHKLQFFENGATPNLHMKTSIDDVEKLQPWIDKFREQYEGVVGAYRTLFTGAGTDATVIGANMRQMDFKSTQGAGETRIASAAGVPPVIAGFSEGLEAATYSNYSQARRRFADGTMRPLWRNMSASLERIIAVPAASPTGKPQLWYDDRDIPFLQEDQTDAATVLSMKATAMSTLITAGYEPDSVTAAIESGDLRRLVHTGLTSVQLLPGDGSSTNGASAPMEGGVPSGP